ncbi:MAG: hypothetical protein ACJAXA_000173 [Candidatus Aldehydirespiratoraceae bacterium]|jgi:hypothetical protein
MTTPISRADVIHRVEHLRGGHRGGRAGVLRCITRWNSRCRPQNYTDATPWLWTNDYRVWMTSTVVRCGNVDCPQSTGPTTSSTFETSLHEEKSRL